MRSKPNRNSKAYQYEFLFFWIFYIIFSCFIFSITRQLQLDIIVIIAITGLLYALINTEIFSRYYFGYSTHQIIAIPILILFVYIQYNILEFAT